MEHFIYLYIYIILKIIYYVHKDAQEDKKAATEKVDKYKAEELLSANLVATPNLPKRGLQAVLSKSPALIKPDKGDDSEAEEKVSKATKTSSGPSIRAKPGSPIFLSQNSNSKAKTKTEAPSSGASVTLPTKLVNPISKVLFFH